MDIFKDELIKERNNKAQIGIADVLNDFIISLDEYFRAPDRTKIPIGDDREINILTDNTDLLRKAFEAGRVPNQNQLKIIKHIAETNLHSLDINPNIFEDAISLRNIKLNTDVEFLSTYNICSSSIEFLRHNNFIERYRTKYEELLALKSEYEILEASIKNIYNICKEYGYD